MIKFGILENNAPNPRKNPPNKDKSKVNDIGDDGIVGINGSPAPNPKNPKIIPIRAVAHIPKNTHAGTFCT